jgi:molybdopterin/thiamine biosynthesis adenylyltransferase
MNGTMEALSGGRQRAARDTWRPEIFRPGIPKDKQRLLDLVQARPDLDVHDELIGQLQELVRSLNPSIKFGREELKEAAIAHLKGVDPVDYGTWVFYPWSNRLVHLLDDEEFALVRTDRNRNKITREEQAVLATKKVGVIGLSVGQSVSLAMALERSFGEIRLADFDTLELSNLNRIRSGVHHLGLNKVVNVAREIAEIDPYLKVTCFTDGITRENIDAFFTTGGTLDLLVEECDSVDIKIIARQKAKALRVPVVMDTSDRGMIDVERFDLEPDRPLMHGRLNHLDLSMSRNLDLQERFSYIMTMVDQEGLSTRMKSSLTEIGRSIVTWPQLGSHVLLGGASVADTVRRVFLGQLTTSGRWYVDLDNDISAHRVKQAIPLA